MSAFHRLIFSTFLFLALGCFWTSSAFAATHKFYKTFDGSYCNISSGGFTSHMYNLTVKANTASYKTSYSGSKVTVINSSNTAIYIRYNQSYLNPNDNTWSNDPAEPYHAGWEQSHECLAGEQFILNGCTPKCVPDPCKAKQGIREAVAVQCGTVSCAAGVTLAVGSSAFTCSAGVATFSPQSPAGDVVKDACAMVGITSEDLPTLAEARAKPEDLGPSSVPMYCNYTYEYTGQSGGQDTPPNNASLTLSPFSGAILPDAQGNCDNPEYPIKGIKDGQNVCYPQDDGNNCPVQGEKENSNGVCVGPDDPTYPKDNDPTKPDPKTSCPTGQIRNNSGKCVPYADAGKCPVGQIRDNIGSCSPDPKSNACPTGQVKNKTTGACTNDPRGTGCNDGSLPDKQGLCANGTAACPSGQTRNTQGICASTQTPDKTGCADGSTPNVLGICADGKASCPVGKVRGQDGKCVLDTTESNSSGTASGDCDVAPDCGGDPLQCASLEQIWRSGCEQIKAMSEISQEDTDKITAAATASKAQYDEHQAAVDAQATAFFSDFETKASAVSTSAQCISDASFSVMGKSLVVPFSQACPYFKFLRILVLFSAYMLSARILFGGVS